MSHCYEPTPQTLVTSSVKRGIQQKLQKKIIFIKQIEVLHKHYLLKRERKMNKLVNRQIQKYKGM